MRRVMTVTAYTSAPAINQFVSFDFLLSLMKIGPIVGWR